MSGCGGVNATQWDMIVPPECAPSPNISRLNARLQWEEAKEPLHEGVDLTGILGVGPGLPFSNALLSSGLTDIGLVPCAEGGTSIQQWSRGSRLYNQLLTRAAAAMAQGPADLYKSKFQQFVSDIRSDLRSPLLPVVEVALASGGVPALREIARKAQLESGSEVVNVSCVDAKGFPLEDGLHLTTAAQVKLGQIMAKAFLHYL